MPATTCSPAARRWPLPSRPRRNASGRKASSATNVELRPGHARNQATVVVVKARHRRLPRNRQPRHGKLPPQRKMDHSIVQSRKHPPLHDHGAAGDSLWSEFSHYDSLYSGLLTSCPIANSQRRRRPSDPGPIHHARPVPGVFLVPSTPRSRRRNP